MNKKQEPVSRVGAVLFVLTLLVIAGLLSLPVILLFSFDDIVRSIAGMFSSCPICGNVFPV